MGVTSIAGQRAPEGEAVYAASKFAQVGFMRSLDHELYGKGVRCSIDRAGRRGDRVRDGPGPDARGSRPAGDAAGGAGGGCRALRGDQAAIAADPGDLDPADERRLDGLNERNHCGEEGHDHRRGQLQLRAGAAAAADASEVLGDSTVTLMDIDQGRLDTMQRLGEKLIEGEGSALRVESTTDQREALDGRRLRDRRDLASAASTPGRTTSRSPAKYGIVMHVADSVGPGGIMRAIRNIPVLAEVARNVRRGGARRLGLQLHQPGADRGDGDARRRAPVRDVRAVLVHRASGQRRVAGRRGRCRA